MTASLPGRLYEAGARGAEAMMVVGALKRRVPRARLSLMARLLALPPRRAGLAIALAGLALPAAAQTPALPPVITVEGQARADLAPDAADLTVTIEAERPAAAAASAEAAKVAQAVTDSLRADGIADKDMRTAAIGLEPVYPDDTLPATTRPRLPRGYRAFTHVVLTVRPPERAGLVAAHAVDKGATGIEGLTFTSSEQAATIDRLRGDAMRDARRKAALYVEALGLTLGQVLEITPQESGFVPQMSFARATTSILAAPTPPMPVLPGPIHLQTAVTVRFAIVE